MDLTYFRMSFECLSRRKDTRFGDEKALLEKQIKWKVKADGNLKQVIRIPRERVGTE